MIAGLLEILPVFVELVFFGIGTVLLSVAGVYIERFAFATMETGQIELATWAAVIGAVAFVFAYLIATDKVHERWITVRDELASTR